MSNPGLFGGKTSSGSLFGKKEENNKENPGAAKPASGGLFGSASSTKTSGGGGLFGGAKSSGAGDGEKKGLFGSTASGGGNVFGQKKEDAKGGSGSLFGGAKEGSVGAGSGVKLSSGDSKGGLFGQGGDKKDDKSTGGVFQTGTTTQKDSKSEGGLFSGAGAPAKKDDKSSAGGLFGSTAPKKDDKSSAGGLFGSSGPKKDEKSSSSSPFGDKAKSSSSSPFGDKAPTGGSTFAAPVKTSATEGKTSTFGATPSKASGSGMFGSKPKEGDAAPKTDSLKPGGNLFGGKKPEESKGSSVFGSKDSKSSAPSVNLFGSKKEESGDKKTTPSAFGKPAGPEASKSSLFPSKPDEKKGASPFGKKEDGKEESKGPSKTLFKKLESDGKEDKGKFGGFGAKPNEDKKDKPEEKKPAPFGAASGSKSNMFGQTGDKKKGTLPVFPGAKKEDGKKEEGKKEEEKKPMLKKNDLELVKKQSLDDAQKLNLSSSTLEDLFAGWQNKVEGQSKMFKDQAKRLKKDELILYDNLATLESLNNYSERVIQDYGVTLNTMQGLAGQQKTLMDSLDKINGDIDEAITKNQQGINTYNRFRGIPLGNDDEMNSKINYRQQMSKKATDVNESLDQIESTVKSLGDVVSNKPETQENEDEDSEQIGKVLNQAYDSLRWIQDTAIDLNYQIELLDNELENL